MTSGQKKGTFSVLVIGIILGIIFWGGFNWALAITNTEEFCISCHEMEIPFEELQDTIHYTNRTGVRATCPDCHVPKEWIHKIVRKVQASRELYHHFITKDIDTPEKYEAKRLHLAQNVWRSMKKTDSRECRNCHDMESMDFDRQESRSADRHDEAIENGYTCIECHKGIAHALPEGYDPGEDTPGETDEG